MRERLCLAALLAVLGAGSVHAVEPAAPEVPVVDGYDFTRPRTLVLQRIFGLAHGVGLLAGVCGDHPEAVEAYERWHSRQQGMIERVQRDLAPGLTDGDAMHHLASALHLPAALKLDPARREAACATLPQALEEPRYELAARWRLAAAVDRLSNAGMTEARFVVCRGRADAAQAGALDAAWTRWGERHAEAVSAARALVSARWVATEMGGSIDDWLRTVRRYGRRLADGPGCTGLPEWLESPAADPGHAFGNTP
ncbi:MAG: hypothetical protein JSR19_06680 [Proteobacteria bacterium]|nr:hypothetical protein [Pseudomonadota bacterium]HQR04837.1 hypothetical protein [Rhodocyclaceae bacterium]